MRKILIGVLSVAGLLATVLALASSSATAQMVVAFQTDTQPGTYSVSWSTRGGCDPSRPNANTTLATDGATGTRSGTVSVPPATAGTAVVTDLIVGSAVEFSVAVAQHCTYDYSVSFTSSVGGSKGIRCAVGYTIGDAGAGEPSTSPGTRDGVLTFTEVPGTFADEIVLAVEDGAGVAGAEICNTVASVSVSIPRPTAINADGDRVPDQPHSGAILNTTFTVNANAVKDSNDECETVSEDTETKDVLDDNNGLGSTDDDTVGASLTVVRTPLSDPTAVCEYEVSADLTGGFVPLGRTGHLSDLESYALFPANKFVADDGDGRDVGDVEADAVPTTTADCGRTVVRSVGMDNLLGGTDLNADTDAIVYGDRCVVLNVRVALRSIYVLQNVVGDSGGANARYSLTLDKECAIPHDLPGNLEANRVGGIQTTPKVTVVELREGFHNISAAVMGRMVTDVDDYERTYAPRFALNKDGEACSFTAKVTDLPGNCDAAEDSISANAVTGSDSRGRVIVTFDIGCSEDTGADDADDDDDADDAMGAMDDDADDAMGAMDDDADDAMGPPEDVATG